MIDNLYASQPGRYETFEVIDFVSHRVVMDSVPTALAAENIARELNRARQQGYCAAKAELREWLQP